MVTFWIEFWYLVICLPVAIWVSWTLHKNGRVFLVEVFQGKEDLADSVNHMLVVGAYLVSIGFVTLAIKIGSSTALQDMSGVIEQVSMKVGLVLVVLGGSHFLNLLFLIPILFISGRVKRWEVEPNPAGASPNLPAALSVVCQPSVAAAGVLWPTFWPLGKDIPLLQCAGALPQRPFPLDSTPASRPVEIFAQSPAGP